MKNVFHLIRSDWLRYTVLHKKMNPLLFVVIYFRNPGMFFSVLYRIERYLLFHSFILFKLLGVLLYPLYFMITYYILDIDISPRVDIGEGLYVHNRGIIFTDQVVAGKNLTLIGPLTLGTRGVGLYEDARGPTLGNNITVYAGARIVGPVKLGDNVYIGANAVVVKDIAANCIVGGVPAKILKKIR
jgi:serine O-acetyltransferase